jgi:hypothetical protein
MYAALLSSAAVGAAAARAMTLVVEIDGGGRGHGSRGSRRSASEAGPPDQSEANKVTWLQANKYYTTKEYTKFTAAKKAWIHQHHTKSTAPKRKVANVLHGEDNTATGSDDNRDLFGDLSWQSQMSAC